MYRLILFTLLTVSSLGWTSDLLWNNWQDVKNLYDSQKYQEALLALQTHPMNLSSYFYNLGTLHSRIGNIGLARANLEKARQMRPNDSDIQHNLKWVRAKLAKNLGEDQLDPSSHWIEQMTDHITLDESRVALGLFGLLALFLFIHAYRTTHSIPRLVTHPTGISALCLFVCIAIAYTIQQFGMSTIPAICTIKGTIWSGPGTHYMQLSQLESGIQVRVLQNQPMIYLDPHPETKSTESVSAMKPEGWRQIRFALDGVGWIQESRLLML